MTKNSEKLIESYEISKQSIDGVINPLEVIQLFEKHQIEYMLVGGHMLAYHTDNPRATVDVDFIIAKKDFKQAVSIINNVYPNLILNDKNHHITFDDKNDTSKHSERIDLIKDEFPLFKLVLKSIQNTNEEIKIPILEAAIVLKFAACISPNRPEEDKLVDQADLIQLIKSNNNLNKKIVSTLSESIYTGGSNELMQVIEDVLNNKAINL